MVNTEYKNILAINFGGIGDEIFFLPTLISLKKEFPNSKITLALEPRSKSVNDLTDIIDELFLLDIKGKNKYTELLKLIFLIITINIFFYFIFIIDFFKKSVTLSHFKIIILRYQRLDH